MTQGERSLGLSPHPHTFHKTPNLPDRTHRRAPVPSIAVQRVCLPRSREGATATDNEPPPGESRRVRKVLAHDLARRAGHKVLVKGPRSAPFGPTWSAPLKGGSWPHSWRSMDASQRPTTKGSCYFLLFPVLTPSAGAAGAAASFFCRLLSCISKAYSSSSL